jgi:hypothetical protein
MEPDITSETARERLDDVGRARAALAQCVRMPGWYTVLYAAALGVLFVIPGLSVRPGHELSPAAVSVAILVAVAALVVGELVLRRSSGTRLRTRRRGGRSSSPA